MERRRTRASTARRRRSRSKTRRRGRAHASRASRCRAPLRAGRRRHPRRRLRHHAAAPLRRLRLRRAPLPPDGRFLPDAGRTSARGGCDLRAAPARAGRARVTLRAPEGTGAGRRTASRSSGRAPAGAVTVDERRRALPDDRHRSGAARRRPSTVGGHVVRYLHRSPRPPGSEDQPLPYVREDVPGAGARRPPSGRCSCDAMLCGPTCAPTKVLRRRDRRSSGILPITLIEAPLRHQLVQVHGNVILVSDQIFRIFPVNRLRKYHASSSRTPSSRRSSTRGSRATEAPDRSRPGGRRARRLPDASVFTLHEFKKIEYATDLLRPFDFVPAVDQLLYAPLLASSSSYFGDVRGRGSRPRRRAPLRRSGRAEPAPRLQQAARSARRRGLPARWRARC